ncbi:glycosyltransferase [Streptosporangium sp. NBC_01469]|uniref:glycosyltransferase n=1 Tax=Streptosporangium sp. NBC_01469 TaxID=2903898 RepID=UPI002E2DFF21|nr:glycosyltransferase family 2 protein [Streptosporangium sp. NBC_01469]
MRRSNTRPWAAGWLAAAVAARHVAGLRHLRRSLEWLAQPVSEAEMTDTPVHMIVPVLREQQHVAAALEWFTALLERMPGSTLTVVTTAREEHERQHLAALLAEQGDQPVTGRRFPQLTAAELDTVVAAQAAAPGHALTRAHAATVLGRFPLTRDVVARELEGDRYRGAAVRHVHYPGDGRKAAQVNHAVTHLDADSQSYVAVYDVDSRPTPEVMAATLAFIGHRRAADGALPAVLQQPARHTTRATSPHAWERMICRGAADLQTLWTLRREIPYVRRYGQMIGRAGRLPWWDAVRAGVSQLVGHGLFVRGDVFADLGGLPDFTVLDDVPFGYRLTMERIPVESVPVTLVADAPEDVRELLAQSRRWFQCNLDYPKVARAARAAGSGSMAAHVAALAVCFYRGAAWLSASPATAACLLVAVDRRHRPPVRTAAIAALAWGVAVPVVVLTRADRQPLTAGGITRRSAGVLAAYLLRSIGPWQAVARTVAGRPAGPFAPKANSRTVVDPRNGKDPR